MSIVAYTVPTVHPVSFASLPLVLQVCVIKHVTAVQKAATMYAVPAVAAILMYITIAGIRALERIHWRQVLCGRCRAKSSAPANDPPLDALSEAMEKSEDSSQDPSSSDEEDEGARGGGEVESVVRPFHAGRSGRYATWTDAISASDLTAAVKDGTDVDLASEAHTSAGGAPVSGRRGSTQAIPAKGNGRRPSQVVPWECEELPACTPASLTELISAAAPVAASEASARVVCWSGDVLQSGRRGSNSRRRSSITQATPPTQADDDNVWRPPRRLSSPTAGGGAAVPVRAAIPSLQAVSTGQRIPFQEPAPLVAAASPSPPQLSSLPPTSTAPLPPPSVARQSSSLAGGKPHAHAHRRTSVVHTGSARALVYAASTRMVLFAYSSLVHTTLKLLR